MTADTDDSVTYVDEATWDWLQGWLGEPPERIPALERLAAAPRLYHRDG